MAAIKLDMDGKEVAAETGQTLLQAARAEGVEIPTLCAFDGLSMVGACRLCLVEIEGSSKLQPACTTLAAAGQKVRTASPKLRNYRRLAVELFFSERNHNVCSVCVANNRCELQKLGYSVGMDHVRLPYLVQEFELDASHPRFVLDHGRCVLCTRCVRVCDEVEGAHTLDVSGRGFLSRVITDYQQPWGDSSTCTSCGKCAQVCPVGAIWPKPATVGRLERRPEVVSELVARRKAK